MAAQKTTISSNMKEAISLEEATKVAPNGMGCYQIYKNNELVYVGKAEDGIRKRFVQYYNGTTADYTSGRIINYWKDDLTVKWSVFDTKEAVRKCEANWISDYKPFLNSQSGWGDKGVLSAGTSTVVDGVKVMSPEACLADLVGTSVKSSVKGAVGATALVEVAKSLWNGDDITECTRNVVSKGAEAAVTSAGAATASEVAGLLAVAAGAGPIGMGIAATGAALATGLALSEATDGVFDELGDKVEDGLTDILCGVCDVVDNVGSFFSGIFGIF